MVCPDDEINICIENLNKPREESKSGHLSHCHSEISNTVNILFIIFSSLPGEVFLFICDDALAESSTE